MTFVDAHQTDFANHGVCARAATDPEFDRNASRPKAKVFAPISRRRPPIRWYAADRPSEYRPYASRARWIRTANDSYFTAMTYPQGLPTLLQPANIHDATWGVLSAVYGGAVHPTAEGHAAMADAALPAMRKVLGIAGPEPAVNSQPLPLPGTGNSGSVRRYAEAVPTGPEPHTGQAFTTARLDVRVVRFRHKRSAVPSPLTSPVATAPTRMPVLE